MKVCCIKQMIKQHCFRVNHNCIVRDPKIFENLVATHILLGRDTKPRVLPHLHI